MIVMAHSVTFRRYQAAGLQFGRFAVDAVNRELAPVGMEKLFEQYISMTIDGELKHLEVFSEAKRNSFWVVESANEIVGSFGIESHSINDTELRRMYLDKGYRGLGIAQRMLDCAQAEARALGFTKMTVSTAQIQKAADRFYRKNGFRLIRTEVADKMTIVLLMLTPLALRVMSRIRCLNRSSDFGAIMRLMPGPPAPSNDPKQRIIAHGQHKSAGKTRRWAATQGKAK